ncbi:MAG: hypothetical protein NWR72_11510 [Bacteroidia bacterium]|nr:hypothetical protein [Bacteroidia bacterium]
MNNLINYLRNLIPSSSFYAVVFRYSVFTSSLLALYLISVAMIAPEHLVDLRFFNIFFLAFGVCLGLRDYFHRSEHKNTNYLDGWAIGLLISMLSGLIIGISSLVYLRGIVPQIGQIVEANMAFGKLNLEVLPVIMFWESTFSGVMVSFISMQYFKNVKNVRYKF